MRKKKSKKLEKKIEKPAKKSAGKRTRHLSSNKLVAVIFVSVIAIILIACGIAYFINVNHMEEVSIEDDEVVALEYKYLRGESACIDYSIKLFNDGTLSVKDMDYDSKEQIAIDYAARRGYDKLSYNELSEIYKLLFNDGSSLQQKLYYESTGGSYEKTGEAYELAVGATCSSTMPYELVCLSVNKAYKSDQRIAIVAGLASGTAETGYLYSGLDWNAEPLGIYGEFEIQSDQLAKWEIGFKYDNKLKKYFLDYTKKL